MSSKPHNIGEERHGRERRIRKLEGGIFDVGVEGWIRQGMARHVYCSI